MRPLCGCGNQAERITGDYYRSVCSSCRKRRRGRPIGGFHRKFPAGAALRRTKTCEDCGLTHDLEAFFDVHHRDGDPGNNDPANLALLCPNCHRATHLS